MPTLNVLERLIDLELMARDCDDWLETHTPPEITNMTLVGAFALNPEPLAFGFCWLSASGQGAFWRPDYPSPHHVANFRIPWERALPVKDDRYRARKPGPPSQWLPLCAPTGCGWTYLVCDGYARSGYELSALSGTQPALFVPPTAR